MSVNLKTRRRTWGVAEPRRANASLQKRWGSWSMFVTRKDSDRASSVNFTSRPSSEGKFPGPRQEPFEQGEQLGGVGDLLEPQDRPRQVVQGFLVHLEA